LVVVLAVGIAGFFELRDWRLRVPLALLLGGALTCLLFTYTRSAWIGFGAVVLILGTLSRRRLLLAAAVIGLAVMIALPDTVQQVEHRLQGTSSSSQLGSVNTGSWAWRTSQWNRMVPRGAKHLLTGTGFGSYRRETVKEF